MLRYFCFLALFLNVKSASAPFIKPCKDGDNACILASSQAAIPLLAPGMPSLGVKSLDPLKVPRITSDQGSLKLTFTDTMLTGLKGCKIESIKHDRVKGKQTLVLRCDMVLDGDYVLDGQLLILPVQGKGRYKIDIRDIVIKTVTDLTTEQGPDGKEHWKIVKWRDSFQVKTGVKFHFDNLFNGNKVLADPVIEFANTNWNDVMQEIAPPIVHTIIAAVFKEIESLYKAVPADELYIP
ncbi:PREDICTED: protein takeout-like [Papilio xuthus]|uniref:Circadian clock-controlled protein n=1 Tax=Papilio xuthus TaxID=66420 RepID=I4DKQ2_PAPXU|nr:protein takeout-like precursor [Papilio xuthus]KPI95934.1 Circadian clock-controlled protein [Papilio xuthus]BAM18492.1 takeout/JHBP like protein [Papilio xuthus]